MPAWTHLIKRFTSTALVLAFVCSETAQAAAFEPITAALPQSPQQLLLAEPTRFEPPLDFVNLKEVHKGREPVFILHIQDAHSNLSGQENLASTLDYLMAKYDVSLVLSEGGANDCSLTPLKKMAPPAVWKTVAKSYLVQGLISGEEYLNLVSDKPMKIVGIEDVPLYLKSVENYAKLAKQREAILGYLKKIHAALEKLKKTCYPAELLGYEKRKAGGDESFEAGFRAFLDLVETKKLDLGPYPNLVKLTGVQRREKEIDFNLANLEQARLVQEIALRGGESSVEGHFDEMSRMKGKRLSQHAFFQKTFDVARARGVVPENYPNLMRYAGYLKDFSEINLEQLLGELARAEDALYLRLLEASDSRLVRSIDRYVSLLDVAYNIQMSTDDFRTFEANEPDFSTVAFLAFLNRKLAEAGYFQDMIPLRDLLAEGRQALMDFYDSVARRDEAFLRNTSRVLVREKQGVAVLISGGYHTPHLAQLFAEAGYSYAVMTPIVTAETNQRKYERLLLDPIVKEAKKVNIVQGESRISGKSLAAIERLPRKKTDGVRRVLAATAVDLGLENVDIRAILEDFAEGTGDKSKHSLLALAYEAAYVASTASNKRDPLTLNAILKAAEKGYDEYRRAQAEQSRLEELPEETDEPASGEAAETLARREGALVGSRSGTRLADILDEYGRLVASNPGNPNLIALATEAVRLEPASMALDLSQKTLEEMEVRARAYVAAGVPVQLSNALELRRAELMKILVTKAIRETQELKTQNASPDACILVVQRAIDILGALGILDASESAKPLEQQMPKVMMDALVLFIPPGATIQLRLPQLKAPMVSPAPRVTPVALLDLPSDIAASPFTNRVLSQEGALTQGETTEFELQERIGIDIMPSQAKGATPVFTLERLPDGRTVVLLPRVNGEAMMPDFLSVNNPHQYAGFFIVLDEQGHVHVTSLNPEGTYYPTSKTPGKVKAVEKRPPLNPLLMPDRLRVGDNAIVRFEIVENGIIVNGVSIVDDTVITYTVGRGPKNQIRIADPQVSREHFLLKTSRNGHWWLYIEPHTSGKRKNDVWYDDAPLPQGRWIELRVPPEKKEAMRMKRVAAERRAAERRAEAATVRDNAVKLDGRLKEALEAVDVETAAVVVVDNEGRVAGVLGRTAQDTYGAELHHVRVTVQITPGEGLVYTPDASSVDGGVRLKIERVIEASLRQVMDLRKQRAEFLEKQVAGEGDKRRELAPDKFYSFDPADYPGGYIPITLGDADFVFYKGKETPQEAADRLGKDVGDVQDQDLTFRWKVRLSATLDDDFNMANEVDVPEADLSDFIEKNGPDAEIPIGTVGKKETFAEAAKRLGRPVSEIRSDELLTVESPLARRTARKPSLIDSVPQRVRQAVSRDHASIRIVGDKLYIRDNSSTFGSRPTFYRGEPPVMPSLPPASTAQVVGVSEAAKALAEAMGRIRRADFTEPKLVSRAMRETDENGGIDKGKKSLFELAIEKAIAELRQLGIDEGVLDGVLRDVRIVTDPLHRNPEFFDAAERLKAFFSHFGIVFVVHRAGNGYGRLLIGELDSYIGKNDVLDPDVLARHPELGVPVQFVSPFFQDLAGGFADLYGRGVYVIVDGDFVQSAENELALSIARHELQHLWDFISGNFGVLKRTPWQTEFVAYVSQLLDPRAILDKDLREFFLVSQGQKAFEVMRRREERKRLQEESVLLEKSLFLEAHTGGSHKFFQLMISRGADPSARAPNFLGEPKVAYSTDELTKLLARIEAGAQAALQSRPMPADAISPERLADVAAKLLTFLYSDVSFKNNLFLRINADAYTYSKLRRGLIKQPNLPAPDFEIVQTDPARFVIANVFFRVARVGNKIVLLDIRTGQPLKFAVPNPDAPDGYDVREEFTVTPETPLVIGRADNTAFDLAIVSNTHAKIYIKDGSYYLQDFGSTNGTKREGIELQNLPGKEHKLTFGTRLAEVENAAKFFHKIQATLLYLPKDDPARKDVGDALIRVAGAIRFAADHPDVRTLEEARRTIEETRAFFAALGAEGMDTIRKRILGIGGRSRTAAAESFEVPEGSFDEALKALDLITPSEVEVDAQLETLKEQAAAAGTWGSPIEGVRDPATVTRLAEAIRDILDSLDKKAGLISVKLEKEEEKMVPGVLEGAQTSTGAPPGELTLEAFRWDPATGEVRLVDLSRFVSFRFIRTGNIRARDESALKGVFETEANRLTFESIPIDRRDEERVTALSGKNGGPAIIYRKALSVRTELPQKGAPVEDKGTFADVHLVEIEWKGKRIPAVSKIGGGLLASGDRYTLADLLLARSSMQRQGVEMALRIQGKDAEKWVPEIYFIYEGDEPGVLSEYIDAPTPAEWIAVATDGPARAERARLVSAQLAEMQNAFKNSKNELDMGLYTSDAEESNFRVVMRPGTDDAGRSTLVPRLITIDFGILQDYFEGDSQPDLFVLEKSLRWSIRAFVEELKSKLPEGTEQGLEPVQDGTDLKGMVTVWIEKGKTGYSVDLIQKFPALADAPARLDSLGVKDRARETALGLLSDIEAISFKAQKEETDAEELSRLKSELLSTLVNAIGPTETARFAPLEATLRDEEPSPGYEALHAAVVKALDAIGDSMPNVAVAKKAAGARIAETSGMRLARAWVVVTVAAQNFRRQYLGANPALSAREVGMLLSSRRYAQGREFELFLQKAIIDATQSSDVVTVLGGDSVESFEQARQNRIKIRDAIIAAVQKYMRGNFGLEVAATGLQELFWLEGDDKMMFMDESIVQIAHMPTKGSFKAQAIRVGGWSRGLGQMREKMAKWLTGAASYPRGEKRAVESLDPVDLVSLQEIMRLQLEFKQNASADVARASAAFGRGLEKVVRGYLARRGLTDDIVPIFAGGNAFGVSGPRSDLDIFLLASDRLPRESYRAIWEEFHRTFSAAMVVDVGLMPTPPGRQFFGNILSLSDFIGSLQVNQAVFAERGDSGMAVHLSALLFLRPAIDGPASSNPQLVTITEALNRMASEPIFQDRVVAVDSERFRKNDVMDGTLETPDAEQWLVDPKSEQVRFGSRALRRIFSLLRILRTRLDEPSARMLEFMSMAQTSPLVLREWLSAFPALTVVGEPVLTAEEAAQIVRAQDAMNLARSKDLVGVAAVPDPAEALQHMKNLQAIAKKLVRLAGTRLTALVGIAGFQEERFPFLAGQDSAVFRLPDGRLLTITKPKDRQTWFVVSIPGLREERILIGLESIYENMSKESDPSKIVDLTVTVSSSYEVVLKNRLGALIVVEPLSGVSVTPRVTPETAASLDLPAIVRSFAGRPDGSTQTTSINIRKKDGQVVTLSLNYRYGPQNSIEGTVTDKGVYIRFSYDADARTVSTSEITRTGDDLGGEGIYSAVFAEILRDADQVLGSQTNQKTGQVAQGFEGGLTPHTVLATETPLGRVRKGFFTCLNLSNIGIYSVRLDRPDRPSFRALYEVLQSVVNAYIAQERGGPEVTPEFLRLKAEELEAVLSHYGSIGREIEAELDRHRSFVDVDALLKAQVDYLKSGTRLSGARLTEKNLGEIAVSVSGARVTEIVRRDPVRSAPVHLPSFYATSLSQLPVTSTDQARSDTPALKLIVLAVQARSAPILSGGVPFSFRDGLETRHALVQADRSVVRLSTIVNMVSTEIGVLPLPQITPVLVIPEATTKEVFSHTGAVDDYGRLRREGLRLWKEFGTGEVKGVVVLKLIAPGQDVESLEEAAEAIREDFRRTRAQNKDFTAQIVIQWVDANGETITEHAGKALVSDPLPEEPPLKTIYVGVPTTDIMTKAAGENAGLLGTPTFEAGNGQGNLIPGIPTLQGAVFLAFDEYSLDVARFLGHLIYGATVATPLSSEDYKLLKTVSSGNEQLDRRLKLVVKPLLTALFDDLRALRARLKSVDAAA